jgi:hypothetical protein
MALRVMQLRGINTYTMIKVRKKGESGKPFRTLFIAS